GSRHTTSITSPISSASSAKRGNRSTGGTTRGRPRQADNGLRRRPGRKRPAPFRDGVSQGRGRRGSLGCPSGRLTAAPAPPRAGTGPPPAHPTAPAAPHYGTDLAAVWRTADPGRAAPEGPAAPRRRPPPPSLPVRAGPAKGRPAGWGRGWHRP